MKNLFLKNVFAFIIITLSFQNVFAQTELNGQVKDEYGITIPGVSVSIKGTTQGTITDLNGVFKLNIEIGQILEVKYMGFITYNLEYSGQTNLDIILQEDIIGLEEVVVIGYGTKKKEDLTGSVGVLTTKEIDLQPIQSVEDALQGKMAGVMVSQNSGAPGSAPKVNIRGFTGSPVYVIDGFIGGDINSLNPNDIESVTVLQDASATAIYGSRGANGVILVTTKIGGKSDKIDINFDYYHTISQLAKKIDLLDPVSYMTVVNLAEEEKGNLPQFSEYEIDSIGSNGLGTDWQDEIFQVAHSNNYQLSIAKGGENSSHRFSLGVLNDNGIVQNTDYQRYNLTYNLNSKITSSTNFNLNLSNAFEEYHNSGSGAGNSVVQAALIWSPNLPIIDPLTSDYQTFQGYGASVAQNPIYQALEINRYQKDLVTRGKLSIDQQFLSDFNFKLFGGIQMISSRGDAFIRKPPSSTIPSSVSKSSMSGIKFQGNGQLSYKKTFNNHSINATAVYEVLKSTFDGYSVAGSNPYTDQLGIYSLDIIENITSYGNTKTEIGTISILGRAAYSYKDKLMVTGSIRRDADSRLPEGNQAAIFPSGAIAYKISDEAFLQQINSIYSLKLRASYGETGNVNSLSPYQVLNTVSDGGIYSFNGIEIVPTTGFEDGNNRANPYLIWETSKQFNTGFDLALYNGTIELIADYYIKRSTNFQFDKQIPGYLGGGSYKDNAGDFKNSGIELQLNTKWANTNDFSINASFNFTYNISEVITLPEDSLHIGAIENGFDDQSHITIIGQSVGQLWGYTYLGVQKEGETIPGAQPGAQAGDALYWDKNGNGQIDINDMSVIGNGNPDFTWGVNLNLDYKAFSLNLFFQGVHGLDIYNLPAHGMMGAGSGSLHPTSTRVLDSWTISPTTGTLPGITRDLKSQSSFFVENGSFIRINNITLAYNIPEKLIEKLHIDRLRIYAGVQNLLTLTSYSGYDPETKSASGGRTAGIDRGSFPIPRAYTFGLNLDF